MHILSGLKGEKIDGTRKSIQLCEYLILFTIFNPEWEHASKFHSSMVDLDTAL